MPKSLRLSFIGGNGGILDDALLDEIGECLFHLVIRLGRAWERRLDERVPAMRASQWRPHPFDMPQDQSQCLIRHQLETFDRIAQPFFQCPQCVKRMLRTAHPHPDDDPSFDGRLQPQRRGGDDAERSLGPGKELAQIIAAIVLLQCRQSLEQAAIGHDRLDPHHERTHRPETKDLGSTRIRRDKTTDRGGVFRGKRQRKTPADALGCAMQIAQDHACLDGRHIFFGLQSTNPVHPA